MMACVLHLKYVPVPLVGMEIIVKFHYVILSVFMEIVLPHMSVSVMKDGLETNVISTFAHHASMVEYASRRKFVLVPTIGMEIIVTSLFASHRVSTVTVLLLMTVSVMQDGWEINANSRSAHHV